MPPGSKSSDLASTLRERALRPAPRPTFSRRESRQRYARNLLVPGPPAKGAQPPLIPRPCALAVLIEGKKARGILGGNPAAPRIESRKCFLDGTKEETKGRFAHKLKVANRSFSVAESSPGASVSAAPMRADFLYWQGPGAVALGAPLVTFPATGKSPGAWGGAPKRWEQEPAASCNFRVQGGAPAKALAPDQNRLGDIRRGLGVPGVKICPDLFGVLLGQHRAAHHHLAGEVLSSQRGDGLLHAL